MVETHHVMTEESVASVFLKVTQLLSPNNELFLHYVYMHVCEEMLLPSLLNINVSSIVVFLLYSFFKCLIDFQSVIPDFLPS